MHWGCAVTNDINEYIKVVKANYKFIANFIEIVMNNK